MTVRRTNRRGLTLVELMLAMAVMAGVTVVLGGLSLAVQQSKEHSDGLTEATLQASAATERIDTLVARSGIYRLDNAASRLGVAVIEGTTPILVVWVGTDDAGLASQGEINRLPKQNEIAVIAPNPQAPWELRELRFPSATGDIDFDATDFAATIAGLVSSNDVESTVLADRIRVVSLDGGARVSAVRFTLRTTPSADEISLAGPGTLEWNRLRWAGGVCSASDGLMQLHLRTELLFERKPVTGSKSNFPHTAILRLGSTSRRFRYQPAGGGP